MSKCPDCGKDIKEVIKGSKYYCENCGFYYHKGRFAFTVAHNWFPNKVKK